MVGAILTGAKIAGSLLGNLLNKKGNAAAKDVPVSGPIQAEHITLGPNAVAQAPAKPDLLKAIGNIADIAAPLIKKAGAPAISDVGGALKAALSTLNDDEWFEEYDGNGATFNELLKTEAETKTSNNVTSNGIIPYGAMAVFHVADKKSGTYYNTFISHILAYIRSKTNNILQDDITTYIRVYCNVVKLHEVYYTLRKYEEFMLHTPSNIPTLLTNVVNCYKPENVNITKGIADNLEAYLRATVKLPYALCSYIRWRFGTIFLSSNTKRAGFISYDFTNCYAKKVGLESHDVTFARPVDQSANDFSVTYTKNQKSPMTPAMLNEFIETIKTQLSIDGRALSDFAVAYADHDVRYDVEPRHFDEKEFCLRQNITSMSMSFNQGNGPVHYEKIGGWNLLMDSRLNMNAAIQSITSSSGMIGADAVNGDCVTQAAFPILDCMVYYDGASLPTKLYTYITDTLTVGQIGHHAEVSGQKWLGVEAPGSTAYYVNAEGIGGAAVALAVAVATSLELHNAHMFTIDCGYQSSVSGSQRWQVAVGTLAYDRARISQDSLISIQRSAILNLVRGDYKRKKQLDVKDTATQLVDELTSKNVTISATPVPVATK